MPEADIIPRREECDALLEVIDSVSSAILALSPDGTIVFANDRATRLFESRMATTGGTPLVGSNVEAWLAPLASLLEAQASSVRPTVRLPGAQLLGFSITKSARAGASRYVVSFQDLTRIQALEEERDRLLRLATVGEVMPMILHETKNPLAAACTLLELLIEERTEASLQSDLHGILVEIRRALLSLEGLGSVRRDLRSPTAHAVDHAIREVVSLIDARARRHDVTLEAEIAPLPLLYLDPSSMRAIVLNLVTNAIHACENGGHVWVRMWLGDDGLVLEVEDDGVGMPPEVLARACETFFTTKRSGSGLGLALCARLVDEARGTLSIESAPARGARVHILIPELESEPGGRSNASEVQPNEP
ncbi:MAG: ATP-binding protein [Sandaracinaceae bacterium]|nr:ATP-binding protein [Sandaracinaceae bacterium]